MGIIRNILSPKVILIVLIIIGAGYFSSKFPDEAILIGGISLIVIIGMWLMQITKENE